VELGISATVDITQSLGYYQGGARGQAKPIGGPRQLEVILLKAFTTPDLRVMGRVILPKLTDCQVGWP
jgi:hypothetical protein